MRSRLGLPSSLPARCVVPIRVLVETDKALGSPSSSWRGGEGLGAAGGAAEEGFPLGQSGAER